MPNIKLTLKNCQKHFAKYGHTGPKFESRHCFVQEKGRNERLITLQRKYHWLSGLQFDWIGFYQTVKYFTICM